MLRPVPVLLAMLLGVATLLPGPAQAAEDGYIVGRFVDEYGVPVNALTVQAWGAENSRTTVTKQDGSFTLGPVTTGWAITFDWYDQGPYYQFTQQTWFGGVTNPDKATKVNVPPRGTFDAGTIVLRSSRRPGPSATAINTADADAVRAAYLARLRPQLVNEKDLRPQGCKVARTPLKAQRRTIRAVNFFRALSGVDPVKLDRGLSRAAQKAALIQFHQGFLSHSPGTDARCSSETGRTASSKANLAQGYEGAKAILGYMDDPGTGNTAAGHRRWIVDPSTRTMGAGQVGRFQALYVLGKFSSGRATPRVLSWPTAGYFPRPLEPLGRWSFSSTRTGDFSLADAKVSMSVGGTAVVLKQHVPQAGAGHQATLVWDVQDRTQLQGAVTVTITGMKQRGVALPAYSYTVNLFKPGR